MLFEWDDEKNQINIKNTASILKLPHEYSLMKIDLNFLTSFIQILRTGI